MKTLAILMTCAFLGGDHEAWNGRVLSWGRLVDVMAMGERQPRVALSETLRDNAFGLGALPDLEGEILIADGVAWVSRSTEDGQATDVEPSARATMLAIAYVPRWTEVTVDREVPAAEVEDFLRKLILEAGHDPAKPAPFVIEGPLSGLEMHVLNGECPHLAGRDGLGEQEPFREKRDQVDGLVVGFYAEKSAGLLTHHDSRTHSHALIDRTTTPIMGHVDTVGISPGSVVRVPAPSSRQ